MDGSLTLEEKLLRGRGKCQGLPSSTLSFLIDPTKEGKEMREWKKYYPSMGRGGWEDTGGPGAHLGDTKRVKGKNLKITAPSGPETRSKWFLERKAGGGIREKSGLQGNQRKTAMFYPEGTQRDRTG